MILYLFIFQEKRSVSVEIKWKGGNKGSKARVNITMGDSKYEPALCRGLHSCCQLALAVFCFVLFWFFHKWLFKSEMAKSGVLVVFMTLKFRPDSWALVGLLSKQE